VLNHVENVNETVYEKFAIAVTPYMAKLMDRDDPNCPIRKQYLPTHHEETKPGFQTLLDQLGEEGDTIPGTSVVHRYPKRVLFLVNEGRRRSVKAEASFFVEIGKGDLDAALAVSKKTQDPIVTTLGYALEHRYESLGHALTYAETHTLQRDRRGLPVLDTVITLAPLLGLLGTVTGMISVFDAMATQGGNARSMAAGVSMATIPTMAGMISSIAGLVAAEMLKRKVNYEIELFQDTLTMDH
jgi:biopolymer transport protein ExbB/TolQ